MPYFTFFVHLRDRGKVICFECGKMQDNLKQYKRHLENYHRQEVIKVHVCPYCTAKYADAINAVIHQLDAHRYDKPPYRSSSDSS